MHKRIILLALLISLIFVGSALATSLTLNNLHPTTGSQVSFSVSTSGGSKYTVANTCTNFQTGQFSIETLPVVGDNAGMFTLPDWAISCQARLLRNGKTIQNSNSVFYCLTPLPPGVVCTDDFS